MMWQTSQMGDLHLQIMILNVPHIVEHSTMMTRYLSTFLRSSQEFKNLKIDRNFLECKMGKMNQKIAKSFGKCHCALKQQIMYFHHRRPIF